MQKIVVFVITCFWIVSCVIAQNDSIIIDKFNCYFYKPDQISLGSNEFDRLRNSIAFFKENSSMKDFNFRVEVISCESELKKNEFLGVQRGKVIVDSLVSWTQLPRTRFFIVDVGDLLDVGDEEICDYSAVLISLLQR